jgi:hypothetical protein
MMPATMPSSLSLGKAAPKRRPHALAVREAGEEAIEFLGVGVGQPMDEDPGKRLEPARRLSP